MVSAVYDLLNGMASKLDEAAAAMRGMAENEQLTSGTGHDGATPALDKVAEGMLQQRHARARFLPPSLFHEPAWEILLSLFVAQRRGRTLNVKHLVEQVDAPVTTSQRWIDTLAHMKLVQRFTDPNDRRRIEVSLSETAMTAVERYIRWYLDQNGGNMLDLGKGSAPTST